MFCHFSVFNQSIMSHIPACEKFRKSLLISATIDWSTHRQTKAFSHTHFTPDKQASSLSRCGRIKKRHSGKVLPHALSSPRFSPRGPTCSGNIQIAATHPLTIKSAPTVSLTHHTSNSKKELIMASKIYHVPVLGEIQLFFLQDISRLIRVILARH